MLCLQLFSGFQELPRLRHINFTSQGRIDRYLNIIFGEPSGEVAVQDGDEDYDDDDDEPTDPQTCRLRPDEDISSDAKEFIRSCLTYNSNRRLSARQALGHPWMCEPEEDECLFRRLERDNAAAWEPKKIRLGPFIEKLEVMTDMHNSDAEQEPGTLAELAEGEDEDGNDDAKISPHFPRKPTPLPSSHSSSAHQQRGGWATGHRLSSNGPSSPPLAIRARKRQPGLWADSEACTSSEEEEQGQVSDITTNSPPLPTFTFTPPSPDLPELSASPLMPRAQESIILGEMNSNEHGEEGSVEDMSMTEIGLCGQPSSTASTWFHLREAEKRRNDFKLTECKRRRTCLV